MYVSLNVINMNTKTIQVTLDLADYQKLLKQKELIGLSWHRFVMLLTKLKEEELRDLNDRGNNKGFQA